MAYPEDYPDDLTKPKAQGYLRKHMVVRADPATGLPIGGGSLPGDDLALARAQGYLNRHMVVLADPATGLPVGGGAMAGDDLAWAKSQGYLYRHMTVDADPLTGLPVGGGSLPGDDLAEARAQGYLRRYMVVLVDPLTGLPVGGGALPGDDLTQARAQGYLHKHMILDTDPVTGLPSPIVPPAYVPNAVDFNEATPDYLTRASDLAGNADAYTGTLSFWVRRDGATTTEDTIIANQATTFRVRFLASSNLFAVHLINDLSTQLLTFTSTAAFPASPVWRWFGASWNTNFAAGLKVFHLWNDAGIVATTKADTHAAFLVDYTRAGWAIASQYGTGVTLDGCLSELFFAPGQFIDFSVLANREKFIKDGKPVDLGANGITPLGVTPLIYLKNPAPTCNINSGTGGNFTIVGAPAVASTSPSDYNPITQLGTDLLGYWDATHTARITIATGVSSWTDAIASYAMAQATTTAQPVYSATSFNGAPGITFDGVDDCLSLESVPFPSGAVPCEIWALVQNTALAADATGRNVITYGTASASAGTRRVHRTVVSGVNRGGAVTGLSSGSVSTNVSTVDLSSRHVLRVVFGATETTAYVDGMIEGPNAALPATGTVRTRIGASTVATPGLFWQGQIAAILVTNPLSAAKATGLQNYLMARRNL